MEAGGGLPYKEGVTGFLVRAGVRLVVLAALLYALFFVPLGKRTLYEHFTRIAATPEAKELGAEVETAVESAKQRARDRVVDPEDELAGLPPEDPSTDHKR